MQRTEKYFENDAFRKTAAGVILAAEADAKTGGGRIALDGTVFYPEGGGQPADRGTLTLPDGTVLRLSAVRVTAGVLVQVLLLSSILRFSLVVYQFLSLIHISEPTRP